jgi:hypothetical protein
MKRPLAKQAAARRSAYRLVKAVRSSVTKVSAGGLQGLGRICSGQPQLITHIGWERVSIQIPRSGWHGNAAGRADIPFVQLGSATTPAKDFPCASVAHHITLLEDNRSSGAEKSSYLKLHDFDISSNTQGSPQNKKQPRFREAAFYKRLRLLSLQSSPGRQDDDYGAHDNES